MEDRLFYSQEVSGEVSERISGISYQENETISLEELRYVRVLHYGFDGRVHIGELLVNQSITNDILEIMSELYKNKYPIERMVLVDEYGGDDEQSMSDNNTSAFNYRQIAGSNRLSNHSMGIAIDINPRYNPYVKTYDDGQMRISPANATDYADRTQDFPYKIDENDLCYRLFTEHGFTWGGSWNSVKDYQHFEK
ncbi:MAG: M15 family metallopeptidase [Lachnospiraceae bacterium]|nr:M15 family metallopeptidase [Lachnospiraceae bacterium]